MELNYIKQDMMLPTSTEWITSRLDWTRTQSSQVDSSVNTEQHRWEEDVCHALFMQDQCYVKENIGNIILRWFSSS